MQLHLETDELNLVANILMERIGKASAQATPSGGGQPGQRTRLGPQFYDGLLDKVLARDLRLDTDELEQMGEILSAQKRKLTEQIARPEQAARLGKMQQELKVVERALERINEACVMF